MNERGLVDVPENALRDEPIAFGLTAVQLGICAPSFAGDRGLAREFRVGSVDGYSTNEATSSSDFRLRSGTTQSSAG